VLLLGGSGQIARAVQDSAPAHVDLVIKTHSQLDICDSEGVTDELKRTRANWVINGAAYTSVDLAEDQEQQAIAINDTAVGIIANAAAEAGCRVLHLSTDFVFDGKSNRAYLPTDRTDPISVYGRSKLGGEQHVLNQAGGIVLRTSWVYASEGRNFVLAMLRLMREKDEIRVVCDQFGAPTWARSVATAIWSAVDADAHGGIYHWSDLGVATWYDFAVAVQDEARARGLLNRVIPVVPIRTAEYPTRAKRPAFSVLDTESTRRALRVPARYWRDNLRSMLDELRAA
jgi:dTDP-4-dehydrorhamnose reductase